MPKSRPQSFATTHWSIVLAAGRRSSPAGEAALAQLCERYWAPLYVYVRRRITDVEEARDLTQEFFVRLLAKNTVASADRERGRFRTFLLTALKNFLNNEWDRARARKRGGGRAALALDFTRQDSQASFEPAHGWTAERLYERQWALTLLDRVLALLQAEYAAPAKSALFEHLKNTLIGAGASASYADAAQRLGMTEGAVKAAAHRLRRRYRELLRQEVSQTLADPGDVDEEIRSLFEALGGG